MPPQGMQWLIHHAYGVAGGISTKKYIVIYGVSLYYYSMYTNIAYMLTARRRGRKAVLLALNKGMAWRYLDLYETYGLLDWFDNQGEI